MEKVAIVTGGSRGIGEAICEELINNGYRVILNYKNSYEKAIKIKERLGENLFLIKADVGNLDEVKVMADFCINQFGRIDVLVNNAGISQIKPFADITEEDWDEMIRVNLKGVYNTTKSVIDLMIHQKYGKIINISSIWGEVGASCEVHYSASKAALIGFTNALSKELENTGVTVNCIAPGPTQTGWIDEDFEKVVIPLIPMEKLIQPEDIADTILFLASDKAKMLTGQVIKVSGGHAL